MFPTLKAYTSHPSSNAWSEAMLINRSQDNSALRARNEAYGLIHVCIGLELYAAWKVQSSLILFLNVPSR